MKTFLVRFRWVLFGLGVVLLGYGVWAATVGSPTGGDRDQIRGRLGPTPGPDAEGHIRTQTAYLERVGMSSPSSPAAGLVSLTALARAEDIAALAGDAEVDVVFARFPGEGAEVLRVEGTIPEGVGERAEEIAALREAEAYGLEELAAAAEGAEREELVREAAAKRSAVQTLRSGCACIYAFVAEHTSLARLLDLQRRPEVRLVDVPDPPVDDLSGWELTPILPKEA